MVNEEASESHMTFCDSRGLLLEQYPNEKLRDGCLRQKSHWEFDSFDFT